MYTIVDRYDNERETWCKSMAIVVMTMIVTKMHGGDDNGTGDCGNHV